MNSICVYCGSSDRLRPEYLLAARHMGAAIAERSLELVFGGGKTGLMGALADGALESGGQVTGVIPGYFNTAQLAHVGLTRLEVVETIHQRKARMVELADAFVALPGGYGTLEEFFEVLTWAQIGLHRKPIGLLNVRGYYDPLLDMIDHVLAEGFIYAEHTELFCAAEEPQELLAALAELTPPPGLGKWVERD